MSRTEALENARAIVAATDLPVAADLENGYGDAPQDCATTIRLAAEAGLVGGSIEDASGRAGQPIYEFSAALERVAAAVEAARALPFPFTLCARAENFLHGREDLDDTLRRLRAYADAGADVLYAPGLNRREQIVAVLEAVAPKPVNVLVGSPRLELSLDELEALGVKRVSLGSNLARVAFGAFHEARGATWKRPVRRCLSTVSTTCSAEPVRRLAWLLPLLLAGAVGALRNQWLDLPARWNPWLPLDVREPPNLLTRSRLAWGVERPQPRWSKVTIR